MALKHLLLSGWPNPVAADVTAITLGATGTSMLAANLKDGEPQNNARITSVFPHQSYIEVDFTVATQVRALALVKHTLIPGDQVRVVGVESGSLPPVRSETLAPDAVVDFDNVIQSPPFLDNINEHPSTPDGTIVAQSSLAAPMYVQVSFPTPSAAPAAGPNLQCFLVWASSTVQVDPGGNTILSAALYEGGVLRKQLGSKSIIPPEAGDPTPVGHPFIFTWDASDLETASGSDVEVRLTFSAGGEGNGLLDAVSWEVLHQADADAADYDTGWETIAGAEPDPEWGNTAPQRATRLRSTWHRFIEPAVSLGRLRVEFRADGLGEFANFQASPPRAPAGYIDVGCLLAAPAFEAGFRFAPGAVLEWQHKYVGDQNSISGSNRRIVQWSKRQARVDLPHLSEDQALSLFERIGDTGADQAGLVSLEPGGSGKAARLGTFWATADEMEPLLYPADGEVDGSRSRGIGFRFVERL